MGSDVAFGDGVRAIESVAAGVFISISGTAHCDGVPIFAYGFCAEFRINGVTGFHSGTCTGFFDGSRIGGGKNAPCEIGGGVGAGS
jgi:hypothetical protein